MRRVLGITLILWAVCGLGVMAAAETISFRADPWMPYTGDPASDHPGYCIELIKAVFEPEGYAVDYQAMPWARDVRDVQSGEINAIVGASHTDCPQCIFPQKPVGMIQNFFYVKKGSSWVFKGVSSLKGLRLGVIDGYSYDDGVLDAYIKDGKAPDIQKATGDTALMTNIKKLDAGRLDVVVENNYVFSSGVTGLGLPSDGFIVAGQANEFQDIFIAFAPGKINSGVYMKIWDKGIAKLRGSGKLASILARYSLPDWEQPHPAAIPQGK